MMRDIVRKYDDTRPVGIAHHIPETAYTRHLRRRSTSAAGTTAAATPSTASATRTSRSSTASRPPRSARAASTSCRCRRPAPISPTQLQVDSYDFNSARWSDIADVEFDLMERDKFVAGEFVWTGFDYLGEPTPFDRQARSSYFGIVDLCGMPKDRYYLYRSYWRPDTHDRPHPAALELARPRRPERAGVRLHQRRQRRAVPQRQVARPAREDHRLHAAGRTSRQASRPPPAPVGVRRGQRPDAADQANDGNGGTRWTAASGEQERMVAGRLGQRRSRSPTWSSASSGKPGDYSIAIDVSDDGKNWRTVATHDKWHEGWGDQLAHGVNTEARYVRVEFTDLRNDARAGLREVSVYPQSYYAVTDKYRLRWIDVAYEPGELKAVAYKDGKQIGEAVMRTAGEPAAIRLTPDRTTLSASGDDLCYVLVEARRCRRQPLPAGRQLDSSSRSTARPRSPASATATRCRSSRSRPTTQAVLRQSDADPAD